MSNRVDTEASEQRREVVLRRVLTEGDTHRGRVNRTHQVTGIRQALAHFLGAVHDDGHRVEERVVL